LKDSTTLAIGDGANDVNMIAAAHVGVGISGLEGQQAARSSDYAIGQFKFLKQLLFVHGREAYRRNSFLISFMFFKNIVFVTPIFCAGYYSFFSATPIYNDPLYQCFNLIFTSWPILIFAVFDFEYEKSELLKNPKHYKIGFNNELFAKKVFSKWFLTGMLYGALIFFLCFFAINSDSPNGKTNSNIAVSGQLVFTSVVFLANMKIFLSSHNITGLSWFFCHCSSLVFALFFWFFNLFSGQDIYL
jgi:phospholipid-transporting ATPase